MFNDYNIYDKINIILNKNINKKELLDDDFFNYIFDNYINIENTTNINIHEIKTNLKFNTQNTINITNKTNIKETIEKNQETMEMNIEKYYLVKKLYKKLCLKFHPDKNGNPEIFIKITEYYEYDLLIGLLSICYNYNINIPKLNCVDERKILNEFIFLLNQLHIYK